MDTLKNKKEVFGLAFKATFNSSFWKFIGVGSLGSCFGLINLIWKIVDAELFDILWYTCILLLGLIILRYLFFLVKYSFLYIHDMYMESRWGDAVILMKKHHKELQSLDLERYDEIKKVVLNILNSQVAWLSEFLSAESSLSIKVPKNFNDGLNNWELTNLFRDLKHKSRDTG